MSSSESHEPNEQCIPSCSSSGSLIPSKSISTQELMKSDILFDKKKKSKKSKHNKGHKLEKEHKKKSKHNKNKRKYSSNSDSSPKHKSKKKDKSKKHKKSSKGETEKTNDNITNKKQKLDKEIPGPSVPSNLEAKIKKPMTKEEWEKQQSVIRKVVDPVTGRQRLIKGDGEILEEIVNKEMHSKINKQATIDDGKYFQSLVTGDNAAK